MICFVTPESGTYQKEIREAYDYYNNIPEFQEVIAMFYWIYMIVMTLEGCEVCCNLAVRPRDIIIQIEDIYGLMLLKD